MSLNSVGVSPSAGRRSRQWRQRVRGKSRFRYPGPVVGLTAGQTDGQTAEHSAEEPLNRRSEVSGPATVSRETVADPADPGDPSAPARPEPRCTPGSCRPLLYQAKSGLEAGHFRTGECGLIEQVVLISMGMRKFLAKQSELASAPIGPVRLDSRIDPGGNEPGKMQARSDLE